MSSTERNAPRRQRRVPRARRLWVQTVTTVSTFPRQGLFTKDAKSIARELASGRVSPEGITSGLRMLLFFISCWRWIAARRERPVRSGARRRG